jgi:subtilase family serine protease
MKQSLLLVLLLQFNVSFGNCNQPNYCDRNCWDPAGTHPAQNNPSFTNVTHIIVHHTGDDAVFPPGTDYADVVRFYWDLHVNTNGWSDIGYNWLIDRNGVIYEGRGDGVQGAHFSGMNSGTMGVALIGNFTLETPDQSALNSLENLIAWEATDKNIDVISSSFHASSGMVLDNISGHLDGASTICPGTDLYNMLPSIRNNVSNFPCYNGGSSNAPDLVIENMWTVPSNPNVGEDVDLYVTIKNVGNATADNISLDYFIDGNYIDDDTHSSLDPDEEKDEFENNYVFNSSGTFNYCVFIDPVVNEQDINNNSFCINVNVGNSGGSEDIFLTNVSVSPTTVAAGNDIAASSTMNYSGNQLDSDLPSFNLDYYISTDCNLSSDDIYLDDDTSGLGSDDPTNDENQNLTIPANTPSGVYFILFVADADDELNEVNENNNVECIQITVNDNSGDEDIFLTNVLVSPTNVLSGGEVTAFSTVNYSGSQLDSNLPSFNLDYYLSNDCILSNDDIFLEDDLSGLGVDDQPIDEDEVLTIPLNTTVGTYYILFVADADDELDETNENNNIECVQITVEDELSDNDLNINNEFKIYPNPTSSFIHLESDSNLSLKKLIIYDLNGRLIKLKQGNGLNSIDVSELSKGLYILQIEDEFKRISNFKIMKK